MTKYQSYLSFIRPYVTHSFYKWQLEQKLEQPHCSHYFRESPCSLSLHRWLNHYPHFMYSVFLETKGLWDLQTVELLQILLTALSQHCVLTVRHCQFTFHTKVTSCCSSQIKRMLVDTFIPKPDLASTTNLFAANWAAWDTAGAFEQAHEPTSMAPSHM